MIMISHKTGVLFCRDPVVVKNGSRSDFGLEKLVYIKLGRISNSTQNNSKFEFNVVFGLYFEFDQIRLSNLVQCGRIWHKKVEFGQK